MRIHTLLEFVWIDGEYRLVREQGFEYSGPLAKCDRAQSKKISQQALATSSQDQNNAQASLADTKKSLGDYSSNLKSFMRFGRATYGQGGEFARDQNTIANTTAAAGANKIAGDTALSAMRTGENTANAAPALAESTRAASRDLTSQLAGADASRLQQLTNVNQYGVQASALPAQVSASLYGTGTSGAVGSLNPAASSAQQPSFGDMLGSSVAQNIGSWLGPPKVGG